MKLVYVDLRSIIVLVIECMYTLIILYFTLIKTLLGIFIEHDD
jgi:hypothetical protein